MKHLGIKGGWRKLATACLNNAIKTSDYNCVYNPIFPLICELAGYEENEVIVELIYAVHMKELYGEKWYKGIENGENYSARNGVKLLENS